MSFYQETEVKKTRKNHNCGWCWEKIDTGGPSTVISGMSDGDFRMRKGPLGRRSTRRESAVERAIVEFAELHGAMTLKLSGQGMRGKPDRLFLHQGKTLFLEIKRKGMRPTTLQARAISEINEHGVAADWCDCIGDGVKIITRELLS
jgi:hypothetical protein